MDTKTRIVIAEDHQLFRDGLRLILGSEKSIDIVGVAIDGLHAIEVVEEVQPDIVLLDISMPKMNGIEAIPIIKQKCRQAKVLMLTAKVDEDTVLRALTAGADGYLSKNSNTASLVKAIKVVLKGELWVERRLLARAFQKGLFNHFGRNFPPIEGNGNANGVLTPREREVLIELTQGGTNKEIASTLYISEKTVKSHLNTIFKKLNVSRRLEAIIFAIRSGLV